MSKSFDSTAKPTSLKSIQEIDNLLTDMWGKYAVKPYIVIESKMAPDVEAFLALYETGTSEAIDAARQVVFEKLSVLRGPVWTEFAKKIGFGK